MDEVGHEARVMNDFAQVLSSLDFEVASPALSGPELSRMYKRVHGAIEAGDHSGAVEEAFVLVSNDPWNRDHQIALATCLHHLGQFEDAGRCYLIAWVLDATDALSAYRIGECLGALEHFSDARDAFAAAIKLSWLDDRYADVREHAQRRLEELESLGVSHSARSS